MHLIKMEAAKRVRLPRFPLFFLPRKSLFSILFSRLLLSPSLDAFKLQKKGEM